MNKAQKNAIFKTSAVAPPFHIEISRTIKGITMVVSGIIGISELCGESVELLSHGGRITVKGKLLRIGVFEGNTVEIFGKISDVGFKYGKN